MIGYHGSENTITTIHTGTGMGLYLATEQADAAAYGEIVHTIELSDDATIADWSDIDDAVEAVREEARFDPADYTHYGLLEITEVRDHLAAHGFDGAEVSDVNPDGDDHDAILVWNTQHLTIKEITQ